MPNAVTHFYIYEKAIEEICKKNWGDDRLLKVFPKIMKIGMGFADGGKDRPSLKAILHELARGWTELGPALRKKVRGKKGYHATMASYGYLGSNGPDIWFVPPTITQRKLATNTLSTLMHHNTTGAPVIYGLILLKKQMGKKLSKEEKVLWLYRLAYWLGHITHVAADITVHPFVNSRAGANKLLEKKFYNFGAILLAKMSPPWTLHNIVEQYQDRYVLNEYYSDRESSFRAMAFGSMAALHLREKQEHRFIGETIDKFYGRDYAGKQSYDKNGCKYEYCRAWYFLDSKTRSYMSFRNYLKSVVPSKEQLLADETGFLVGPNFFEKYIGEAIELSEAMIEEAIEFLKGDTQAQGDTPREQVYSVRKSFPLLYMNFNIDAGLRFEFHKCEEKAGIGKAKQITCRVPVRVELKKYNSPYGQPPDWKYAKSRGTGARVGASSGNRAVVEQFYDYWGVDVITEKVKERSGFVLYTASLQDRDQDTVGEKIREKEKGYGGVDQEKITSLCVKDEATDRVSVISPTRGAATGSGLRYRWRRWWNWKPDDEIESLRDRMLVPTTSMKGTWERLGHGRFEKAKVKKSNQTRPTEQLFLKFHFLKRDREGGYVRLPEELKGHARPVFEPGINNIAVVIDEENKLEKVYLDLQKVWDAKDA